MKTLKLLATLFVAALSFTACEPADDDSTGDGELTLKATPSIILCDGNDTSTLELYLGSKKITKNVAFFDGESNQLDIPNMKFSTTKEGTYTIWAAYGDQFSNEVTITAVKDFPKVTELPEDPQPNSTSFVRKVLLEQFTGTNCPHCPHMIDRIKSLPAYLSKHCILTAAHRYNVDDPAYLSTALEQSMAFDGYPSLAVDMHSITNVYSMQGITNSLVQDAIDREDAKAGIAACAVYNETSRMVAIKAEVKAAVTDIFRIGAWLLEDGIEGKQLNGGATGGYNYDIHDNAIRIVDSRVAGADYSGYYLGEIKAGEKKTFEFTPTRMVLDKSWKAENCHLVIFITTEGEPSKGTLNTWYVNNVISCPLNGSVAYAYEE